MNYKIKNQKDFEKAISKKSFILFSASWCPGCKIFQPFFEKVAKVNENAFYYLDTDEFPEIAKRERILSIPTLRFYNESKNLDQLKDYTLEGLKDFVKKQSN